MKKKGFLVLFIALFIIGLCGVKIVSAESNSKISEFDIEFLGEKTLSDQKVEIIPMLDKREADALLETPTSRWSIIWYTPQVRTLTQGGWGVGFADTFNSGNSNSHILSRVEAAGNYHAQATQQINYTHSGATDWHRIDASYFLRGRLAGAATTGSTISTIDVRLRVYNNTRGQVESDNSVFNVTRSWNYNTYIEGYNSGTTNVYLRAGENYSIDLIYYVNTSGGGFAVGYSDFAYNELGGNARQVDWNWVRVQSL